MIRIDELSKHYKQGRIVVHALDEVSLNIESGEFVAVVGRSGSGKTTLLDCLGLLLSPTSGRVVMDGADTSPLKDDQKARLKDRVHLPGVQPAADPHRARERHPPPALCGQAEG